MRPSSDLAPMFERHRALVCVGAGGVGKTTVAAALALAAAQSGRRTLCLTIDPAKRLATSLGMDAFPHEAARVRQDFLRESGIELQAPLTVMMLDARATFDDLIRKFSSSEADSAKILRHRVYRQLSDNLAGTQAYMAMEKVLSVLNDDEYDLVVLDTPPSARALDFFDAPRRMADILDSPATRTLSSAIVTGKKLQMNLAARGLKRAMQSLQGLTGTTLITDVAELLAAMNGLFGGFSKRASEVDGRLRTKEFGYVLVTAPTAQTIADARELSSEMRRRELVVHAVVCNRFAPRGLLDASRADVSRPPFDESIHVSEAGKETLVRLAIQQAEKRMKQEVLLELLLDEVDQRCALACIEAFAEDVHRAEKLMEVARIVAPSAARTQSRQVKFD